MSLRNFNEDLNIVSKLADAPALTASQLKAKFDEGGLKLKEYINESLLPDIEKAINDKGQSLLDSINEISGSIPALASKEDGSENKALSAKAGNEIYNALREIGENAQNLQSSLNSLTTLVNTRQKNISSGQGSPSGGEDGDIYLMY